MATLRSVQALLDAEADVKTKRCSDAWSSPYAHLAANAKFINTQSNYGHTALILALENGHTKIAQALLTAGAEVNTQRTIDGSTALLLAAKKGYTEIVQPLIKKVPTSMLRQVMALHP